MSTLERLRSLGREGLAELLGERPVLLAECGGSLSRLASFVDSGYGVSEALCHTNALQHSVAEAVAALGPVHPHEIAAALGLSAGSAADVGAAVIRLERLLLATRLPDGRMVPANQLRQQFRYPLDLGRPLREVLPQLDVGTLRKAAGLLGLSASGSKAALGAAVSRALRDGDTVRAALASAPRGTGDLVERLLGEVVTDVGYGRPSPAAAWLMERLMVVRLSSYVELAQDVALALRGPVLRSVPQVPPEMPGRAGRDVDTAAAHRSGSVLSLLSSLLDALDSEPATAIQSGELGVRDLRRLAKAADLDEATAGRLLEIGRSAGLIGTLVTLAAPEPGRETRWQPERAPTVQWLPTSAYDAWLDLDPGPRWAALAGAWLDSIAWPSRAGARTESRKTTPAFSSHDDAAEAPWFRRFVLEQLRGLGVDRAVSAEELAPVVVWHRPRAVAWVVTDSRTLVGGIMAEAELLGIVADGALSSLGRALLDDREAAARLAAAALPTPGSEIVLQADLTAVAAGPLHRSVAAGLSAMAGVESRGAATIWRFSDASIGRALDHGGSAPHMLTFLEEHAPRGVPQPLRYLIGDVARRHGRLRVAVATSLVTSDDPALMAEVRVSRKTAKLRLRELAPTVLASASPVAVVLATLRTAGYLPAHEGDDGAISITRPEVRRAPRQAQAPSTPADLPDVAARLLSQASAPAGRPSGPKSAGSRGPILRPAWEGGPFDGYEDACDCAECRDDDGFIVSTEFSAHDLLAEAAADGTEIAVLSMAGRRGREAVGKVALLTEASVVIRDVDGRKQAIALDTIVSIVGCA